VIEGGPANVNLTPFEASPLLNTRIPFVSVALLGMVATICVSLQLCTTKSTPPKRTVLPLSCVGLKFVPVIVTCVPTGPLVGLMLLIAG